MGFLQVFPSITSGTRPSHPSPGLAAACAPARSRAGLQLVGSLAEHSWRDQTTLAMASLSQTLHVVNRLTLIQCTQIRHPWSVWVYIPITGSCPCVFILWIGTDSSVMLQVHPVIVSVGTPCPLMLKFTHPHLQPKDIFHENLKMGMGEDGDG